MPFSALEATAGEVMSSPPVVVAQNTLLKDAARLMIDSNIGCLPVVDDFGKLVGLVTERTFQAQIAGMKPVSAYSPEQRVLEELYIMGPDHVGAVQETFSESYSKPVSEAMLESPPTVARDTPLWKAAEMLLAKHISHLIVVHDDKPVGVIARHDLLRAYANGSG